MVKWRQSDVVGRIVRADAAMKGVKVRFGTLILFWLCRDKVEKGRILDEADLDHKVADERSSVGSGMVDSQA